MVGHGMVDVRGERCMANERATTEQDDEEQWDNVPMAAALTTFQNPSGRSGISSA